MVFFVWSPQVPILLYTHKNIKNSYILYTYVLKYYLEFIVVLDLLGKLEIGNEK